MTAFGMASSEGWSVRGEGVECLALLLGGHPLERLASVAAQRVDVVLSTQHRRRRLHRPAVVEVDGHQRLFDRRERRADLHRVLAHAVERRATDLHEPPELSDDVFAVVPPVGHGAHAHVLVRHIDDVSLPRFVEDAAERFLLVHAVGEVLVAVLDRDLVPFADLGVVGVREIDGAVRPQRLERMRVVHDRDPALGAVVVVVPESERVADLVRRELAKAGERGLRQDRRGLVAVLVGRQQAFEDPIVLAHPQRAERDDGLDDLTGARVDDGRARAPAARRAMDPVDDVVPNVHRVGVFGEDLDPERVPESGRLEGPASTSCLPRGARSASARACRCRGSTRWARRRR